MRGIQIFHPGEMLTGTLCSADDLTSPNVTAAASKIIFDSSEVLAELQATLHP